jgi:YggT family protein
MYLQTFIVVLFRILELAVLIRAVLSWLSPDARYRYPFLEILWQITEPILAPIRRFTSVGMMDLSPIIAIFLLQIVQSVLLSAVSSL